MECDLQDGIKTEKKHLRSSPAVKSTQAFAESPSLCETPVREKRLPKIYENICSPRTKATGTSASLTNLPILTTPPSRFKNPIRNPFEESLRKKLHLPFISPTLFSEVTSSSQDEEFSWSIEDLAYLLPAKIDEFQMQSDQPVDEETEHEVQKSISRFFETNSIVPSPYDTFKPLSIYNLNCTPLRSSSPEVEHIATVLDFENYEKINSPCSKEAWTQTEITVPLEALSPFNSLSEHFQLDKDTKKPEDSIEEEETSTSDQDNLTCSSPCYSFYKSLLSSTIHTPKNKMVRTFGTPLNRTSLMSPIGLSPIVQSFQQVSTKLEYTRESMESVRCACLAHDMSCDSGISSATSQTDLTFPSILPKNIEEVLKPFQTFIQDPLEMDDGNLNSSLSRRRKLLFSEKLDMSVSSVYSCDVGFDTL